MTYVCADGTCLKKSNPECDFVADCPDASDEKQCGEKTQYLLANCVSPSNFRISIPLFLF